jgi:Dyp-type peroxidase family
MAFACVSRARPAALAAALVGLLAAGCSPRAGDKAEPFSLDRGRIDRAKDEKLLRDLQGDILQHHNRAHAAALFLAFKPSATGGPARQWLGKFAARHVTSAFDQDTAPLFGGAYLSKTGYDALGLPYPAGGESDLFLNGMKHEDSRGKVADPEIAEWEKAYRDPIDALVVLAANERADVEKAVAEVRREAGAVCDVRAVEWLGVKTNARGQKVEHFGYVDEISQPVFFASEAPPKGPDTVFDPGAPLSLVLVQEDPKHYPERCGSYLAVRKLRQDVRKFAVQVKELAGALHVSEDLAAALVVGRFKDGTPVTLSDVPKQPNKDHLNQFTFAKDPDGHQCPFHAHIRRLNPRGTTGHPSEEAGHRIVRRSMLYGLGDGPEADREVGTLFLCFQASIEDGFAFLQGDWAYSAKHLRDGNAPDPLLATDGKVTGSGQVADRAPPEHQWWTPWGDDKKIEHKAVRHPFAHCVSFRGGEYFFAPSLGFLRSLR